MVASAHVVEASVGVTSNSPSWGCTRPDGRGLPNSDGCIGEDALHPQIHCDGSLGIFDWDVLFVLQALIVFQTKICNFPTPVFRPRL